MWFTEIKLFLILIVIPWNYFLVKKWDEKAICRQNHRKVSCLVLLKNILLINEKMLGTKSSRSLKRTIFLGNIELHIILQNSSSPGFEPGIFWSVVRRVIHCATSPASRLHFDLGNWVKQKCFISVNLAHPWNRFLVNMKQQNNCNWRVEI